MRITKFKIFFEGSGHDYQRLRVLCSRLQPELFQDPNLPLLSLPRTSYVPLQHSGPFIFNRSNDHNNFPPVKMTSTSRLAPVIIITGTPGTGKSTHAQMLANESPISLKHINVGEWVKERELYEEFDQEWQSYTVDEDKLLDELEPLITEGGIVLDWHTCEIFPERWADLVVVLRCDHSKVWERLEKRGYPFKKIQENNEAEIMQVVLEEARASYPAEIIAELRSENTEDLEANVTRMIEWIVTWKRDREANA